MGSAGDDPFQGLMAAMTSSASTPPELESLIGAFSAGEYRRVLAAGGDVLKRHPGHGELLKLLGCASYACEEYREAVNFLLEAAARLPGDAQIFSNLGNALIKIGEITAALEAHQVAIGLQPGSSESRANLAHAYLSQGERLRALEQFWLSFDLDPGNRELAALCRELVAETGDRQLLMDFCRLNLERLPDDGIAMAVLGGMLLLDGHTDAALDQLKGAVVCAPDSALAWSNLSVALQAKNLLAEAVEAGYRAVALSQEWAAPHNNLGLALKDLGRLSESEAVLRQALEIDPAYAEAWNNLGLVLQNRTCISEAESCFRKALQLNGGYFRAHSNLVFLLNYSSGYRLEERLEEARRFGRALSGMARRFSAWKCDPAPKSLRVGFVSGDLRNHPVGYFLESFLGKLGEQGVEPIAYPTNLQSDELTDRLRPSFAAWRPLAGLGDEEAAALIHGDGVHILVDLSGHTDYNRLPVFSCKPAPVQVSWLGYFATTGLAEMDYVLADPVGVPEEGRGEFIESVRYLPDTRLCFAAPQEQLTVSALPALRNGTVTLGSFQTLAKINEDVQRLWAAVLRGLPGARLRLQCSQLVDPAVRGRLLEQFRRLDIAPERIEMHGPMPRADYLAAHAEVDFLLDTFPYPGGTTTCEALWMGVPTLTLAGDSMLSRQGASLMAAAGLPGWVAANREDYVARGVGFGRDLAALAALRRELRSRVATSALFDGSVFARNLGVVLWNIWDEYARFSGSVKTAAD